MLSPLLLLSRCYRHDRRYGIIIVAKRPSSRNDCRRDDAIIAERLSPRNKCERRVNTSSTIIYAGVSLCNPKNSIIFTCRESLGNMISIIPEEIDLLEFLWFEARPGDPADRVEGKSRRIGTSRKLSQRAVRSLLTAPSDTIGIYTGGSSAKRSSLLNARYSATSVSSTSSSSSSPLFLLLHTVHRCVNDERSSIGRSALIDPRTGACARGEANVGDG